MSLLDDTKAIGKIGLTAAEHFAPEATAAANNAGRKFVEEAVAQILKKPQPLAKALPELGDTLKVRESGEVVDYLPQIARSVSQSDRLAQLKVTCMLGSGGHQLVFATEDNRAIKLGLQNLPRPVHNPIFDAPVLEHGKLDQGVRYYIQPIGDTRGVTDKHVVSVIGKIRSAGYVEEDMWAFSGTRKDQVALFGKSRQPLLIDQEGALPRYGTTFKNGELIADHQQQANLQDIREFLAERGIPLIKHNATRPLNPLQMNERSLSTAMDDWQLLNKIKDHLSVTASQPTLWRTWTDTEVNYALRSLTLMK